VRLLVARCEVRYAGRLAASLPEAVRLLVFKADGSVMVHSDAGGYKPLNWMTAPTVIEDTGGRIVVRRPRSEERLEIEVREVLSDVAHELGDGGGLAKEGVEAELQAALAAVPAALEDGLRLVRREWPTDLGPVDLLCRDATGGYVAVEVKRVGTIDAVEQLSRYLERLRLDPAMEACRGVLAAQAVKPQARTLAEAREIGWREVDLAVLRGQAEPHLTLF
jgi:RecB family endonuclease NucS